MNGRKTVMRWVGAAVILGTAALVVLRWRSLAIRQELALWQEVLESPSPARRLEAAERILKLDRHNRQMVLVRAQALMELGSFARAREALTAESWTDPALSQQAMLLQAQSYLAEAQQAIQQAGRGGMHLMEERVEPLLGEALAIRRALSGQSELEGQLAALEARVLDIRARVLRARLQELDVELSKASAVEAQEQAHHVGIQIGDLRTRLEAMEQELETFCRRELNQHPDNAELWGILFELLFRRNRLEDARQAVKALIHAPGSVSYELAGHVAGLLLDQEWLTGQPCRKTDLDLAEQLLRYRSLEGRATIDYRLALGDLALARQNWSEAERLARATLNSFEGHPQALRQLALALARQNQVQTAIELLVPVAETVRQARLCHALGQVYRLAGQKKAAADQWRQALELEPSASVPRLALVQAMVEDGFTLEAGPDILLLRRSCPEHPQVLALYVRLLAWKLDLNGLAELLSRPPNTSEPISWRHAALAAWMVLEEPQTVEILAEEILANNDKDVLALLARAWLECPAAGRWQLPVLAAWKVLEELESDPLARPCAAPTVNWLPPGQTLQESAEKSLLPQMVAAALEKIFEHSWLLPRPEETAFQLLERALEYWPGQADLLRAHAITAIRLEQPYKAIGSLARLSDLVAEDGAVQAMQVYLHGDFQQLRQKLEGPASDIPQSLAVWLKLQLAMEEADRRRALDELEKALQSRSWDQSLVEAFVRRALIKSDENALHQALQRLRRINAPLAQLAGGRLALHQRRISEALQEIELLLVREPGGSELRCLAAEPRVLIHLAEGHPDLAVGVLESLAISAPRRKYQMQTAAMELLLASGRRMLALAMLQQLLNDATVPVGWMDRLLNRAMQLMDASSFLRSLDEITIDRHQPDNERRQQLVDFYRAAALARSGQLDRAEEILHRLTQLAPTSPRVILEQARLAMRRGRVDLARPLYQQLLAMGGSARQAAQEDLEEHGLLPPTSSEEGQKP